MYSDDSENLNIREFECFPNIRKKNFSKASQVTAELLRGLKFTREVTIKLKNLPGKTSDMSST